MVTVVPPEHDWSQAAGNLVEGLAQGYMSRADEMALKKAIAGLKPNATPREILDTLTNTKTYKPEAKQNALKNLMGAAEFEEGKRKVKEAEATKRQAIEQKQAAAEAKALEDKAKKDAEIGGAKTLVENSDLPEEQKAKLVQDINEGKTNFNAVKEVTKPSKKTTSDFQKGLAKEHVKQYVDAEKAIIQSGRNLQDLDRVEELNKKLSGPLGYFKALNPFNEDAAEIKALGFGAIEPIVKTFNPSGPIAQAFFVQLVQMG